MPAPVIQVIGEQNITIDTDYSLAITVSNSPVEVTVDGLMEGFNQDWDATAGILYIKGHATRILQDAIWTVKAKETADSSPVTQTITYNVVFTAPVIEDITAATIYRGQEADIFIEVQGRPTVSRVEGLLAGLKFSPGTEPDGDDVKEGIRVIGTLPVEARLTVESFVARAFASNDGGSDSQMFTVSVEELQDQFYAFLVNTSAANTIYRIDPSGTQVWSMQNSGLGGNSGLVEIDGTKNFIILYNDVLYKFNHSDGALAWSYDFDTTSYARWLLVDSKRHILVYNTVSGAGVFDSFYKVSRDGTLLWESNDLNATSLGWNFDIDVNDDILISEGHDQDLGFNQETKVYKISGSDGSILWEITNLPTGTYYNQIETDDNGDVYVFRRAVSGYFNHAVTKVQGTDGTILWTTSFASPVGAYTEFHVDGDGNVYLLEGNDESVEKIGADGTQLWKNTTTLPNTGDFNSMAVGSDGSVYLVDYNSDDVYKLNSADGTQDFKYTGFTAQIQYTIKLDSDDNLILVSSTSATTRGVYKLSSSGTLVWTYTIPGNANTYDINVDSDGNVYFFNAFTDDVIKINGSNGSVLWTYSGLPAGSYRRFLG